MSGGIYSNVQPSMLGLEMSLHHNLPPQNPHHHHHPTRDADYYTQQPAKSKNQSLTLSDDEENSGGGDEGKRKASPWQRMKWSDNMVRLLIMVVFYIGDEVGSETNNNNDPASKKKGGGALQKKGKWKSVSSAMMERGFYVSPQQCEDKFNDLNKRYKRVNDILGKGTSCRVVENQALLDSMDLPPKTKEEVRKLLNSKHLFFREMCAYHNSCGHTNSPAEAAAEPPLQQQQQQQRCSHSTQPNLNKWDNEGSKPEKGISVEDEEGEDEEEEEEEEGEEEEGRSEEMEEGGWKKRRKMMEEMEGEMKRMSGGERRRWVKGKMMALEEERVGIQRQAYELEKQRMKWIKFSSNKEREMERERLLNQKMKLENERMLLLLRRKELDLIHQT